MRYEYKLNQCKIQNIENKQNGIFYLNSSAINESAEKRMQHIAEYVYGLYLLEALEVRVLIKELWKIYSKCMRCYPTKIKVQPKTIKEIYTEKEMASRNSSAKSR